MFTRKITHSSDDPGRVIVYEVFHANKIKRKKSTTKLCDPGEAIMPKRFALLKNEHTTYLAFEKSPFPFSLRRDCDSVSFIG